MADGFVVQTLIFPKAKWSSIEDCTRWAREHDYETADVDETEDSWRIRQEDPEKFTRLRTICIDPGADAPMEDSKVKTLLYNLGKAGTSSTDALDLVAKSLVQLGVTGEEVGHAINVAFGRAREQLRPGDYQVLVGMFNRLGLSLTDMHRALPGIIEAMNRELDRLGSEVFEAIFGEDALKQWFPTFQKIFAKVRSLGIESFEEIGEVGPDVLEQKIRALGPAAAGISEALREHGVRSMRDLLTLVAEAQSEDEKVVEAAKKRLEDFSSAIGEAFSELTQRAEAFRAVAESLKGTINSLVIGPESALPLTEQLDYLLRQADLIRSKIAQAKRVAGRTRRSSGTSTAGVRRRSITGATTAASSSSTVACSRASRSRSRR